MGRGAGEYLSLTAFAVVGRDIWIYDNAGFKIRCYDENFQCTAEIPFAVSADEMEAVGDEIFLSCNDKGYDKINYHLYRYDTREQRMSSHLSFPAKPPGMLSIRINQPFAELQDSCLYHYRYCDTLYQIGGSSVEPRYRFVFSGHYRDEPILQSEFNPAESGVIRGLFGIRQTSNSIIFEYSFGNRPQYAIYNKKTKTCIAYESAMKIPPLGDLKIINYSIQAETLLAHFPAYLLLIPEFFDANKIDNPETKRMFEGVVSTLDENSNPVIMRFKLKPDANL